MARKNKGMRNVSLAQSGGHDTTFGTARGGTPLTRGATEGKAEGTGTQNGVNKYTIRAEAGNNAKVPMKGRAGSPPPTHPGGPGITAIVRPKQLPPVLRGSTNALKGKYR